jgi:hypothetical protein
LVTLHKKIIIIRIKLLYCALGEYRLLFYSRVSTIVLGGFLESISPLRENRIISVYLVYIHLFSSIIYGREKYHLWKLFISIKHIVFLSRGGR